GRPGPGLSRSRSPPGRHAGGPPWAGGGGVRGRGTGCPGRHRAGRVRRTGWHASAGGGDPGRLVRPGGAVLGLAVAGMNAEVAYRVCERVTRTRAGNFYYGIRLLPPD